jgi:(2Fe-2S) ferredoxin
LGLAWRGAAARVGGQQAGMADDKLHVLACNNVDCMRRGGQAVYEALRDRVAAVAPDAAEVTQYPCFGGCEYGPNVVVYPAKHFYSGVRPEDVEDIVTQLQSGAPVDRLVGLVDPQIEELIFELLDAGLL